MHVLVRTLRDPAWVRVWTTRAAIQAASEGAQWLEMPVGRCHGGHRDGGLQVATRLLVGGGVAGFARAVVFLPSRGANREPPYDLHLKLKFGFTSLIGLYNSKTCVMKS